MTATNVFLDILSSPPDSCYYQSLREEAATTFPTPEDWEKLGSLSKLTFTDSAIKETLRLNPLAARGGMRQVMHRDGITLPGGHHLPQNAWLGVSVVGIHTDERYYTEPDQYNAFRFVRSRPEPAVINTSSPSAETTRQPGNNSSYLATTEDKFMSFGYGRHSW